LDHDRQPGSHINRVDRKALGFIRRAKRVGGKNLTDCGFGILDCGLLGQSAEGIEHGA